MPASNKSQLLTFIMNRQDRLVQVSIALADWLGYTEKELCAKTLQEISSDHQDETAHVCIEFSEVSKEQVVPCTLFHKNGEGFKVAIQLLLVDIPGQSNLIFCNVRPNSALVESEKYKEDLAAKEQLEMLLNHTEESFLLVDRNLKLVRFNNQFKHLYKLYLGRDVVKGESILDFAYTTDVAEMKNVYERALAGEYLARELDIPLPDGKNKIYFYLSYKPIWSADDTIEGVFVSIVDITQQRRSELQLGFSEKRYKALVEHGMDVVVILTAEAKPVYVSPAVEKMLGYDMEEADNLNVFALTHPDDIESVTRLWEEVLQNPGVPIAAPPSRILHKNGTWRWLEGTLVNMLHEPYINGIVDNFKDVTVQVTAQQKLLVKQNELEQAEANYREIFEKANEGILIYNIDTGLLVQVNKRACEMLGCTEAELMSSSRKQYEADDTAYTVKAAIAKFEKAKAGETQVFEWPIKRKDQTITWLEVSLTKATIAGLDRILGFLRGINERKKAEEEKEFERKDKEALINSTGEYIWSLNEDYRLIAANEPFLQNLKKLTGHILQPGEILLKGELFSEEMLKDWKEFYKRAFAGERFTEEVYTPTKHDRPETWEEVSFNPVFVEAKVVGVACYARDITQNKQYQQQLQLSNQKLELTQQIAKLGLWELDFRTDELQCSELTCLMFGMEKSEIKKSLEVLIDKIHPEDRASFTKEYKYAREGEKLLNEEYRILTGTDLIKTVIFRGSLEYDAANNPCRFNGTVQDITERKTLKDQLVASEKQLDLIYNSVSDIIFLMAVEPDEQYRFESVNQAFLNSMHLERAEVVNKYLHDVIPKNQTLRIMENFRQALQTGKSVSWEASSPITLNSGIITISPIANEEGIFTQIIGAVNDITEIKRTGEKLASLNEQLKLQAKALAESNLELERFAYVASHDLQEPLRMISSFLKLLEKKYEGQLDETAGKYIYYAVDGSERMKRLIMDLLAYSKVSTNDDVFTSTDMNLLVAEVLQIQEEKIEDLKATVTVGPLPILHNTRRTHMFQLLQNLITNALKYHGDDPPIIKIEAEEEATCWKFSIKDNGVGFEQKLADTIFILFQRLHHRSEFGGTGIGLSICKKIVEMHKGKIWVESAPNEGSTFYFTIPK